MHLSEAARQGETGENHFYNQQPNDHTWSATCDTDACHRAIYRARISHLQRALNFLERDRPIAGQSLRSRLCKEPARCCWRYQVVTQLPYCCLSADSTVPTLALLQHLCTETGRIRKEEIRYVKQEALGGGTHTGGSGRALSGRPAQPQCTRGTCSQPPRGGGTAGLRNRRQVHLSVTSGITRAISAPAGRPSSPPAAPLAGGGRLSLGPGPTSPRGPPRARRSLPALRRRPRPGRLPLAARPARLPDLG